jgi:hypothetical protein
VAERPQDAAMRAPRRRLCILLDRVEQPQLHPTRN